MFDPDYDPYEMIEELARNLRWQSEIVEGVTKTQVTANNNILALFKELHNLNDRIAKMEAELYAIKQTPTNNRPRR